MAPSLTKDVFREEMGRFLNESLRPEFATLVDGLRQVLEHQIALEKVSDALTAATRKNEKFLRPGPFASTNTDRSSDRYNETSSDMVKTFSKDSAFRSMNSRSPKNRFSNPHLLSVASHPFGVDTDENSMAMGRVSSTKLSTSNECSWMTRHRMSYSVEDRSQPKIVVYEPATLRGSQSSTNHAAGWFGGVGARLWQRRHSESYRKLHLLRDRVVNAIGAQPDTFFDSSAGSLDFSDEPTSPKITCIVPTEMVSTRDTEMVSYPSEKLAMAKRMSSRKATVTKQLGGEYFSIAEVNPSPAGISWERQQDEPPCFLKYVSNIILSHEFACVVAFLVIVNAAILGLETDYMARYWTHDVPRGYLVAERIICICFVVEILLRLYVFRTDFFTMEGCFDLVVLCLQVMDLLDIEDRIASAKHQHRKGEIRLEVPVWRTLLLVRLTRLVRLVRVANLLHFLAELRMLIISISDSLKSVFWVLFLLILMMYCMGVYFTQVVTSHKLKQVQTNDENRSLSSQVSQLEYYYGNLLRTMLTLFETIASGVSWGEVADPLGQHCSVWMLVLFVAYVFFTMFVFLNVVTGVFVSSATEKATEDRKKVLMFQLREIFREVDDDSTGVMSWTKFQHHLQDNKVQMYLKAIDLHQQEALDLFQLLDTDDSGEIDEDEFVNGCMRLHGNAKAIDLAAFMFDYKSWTRLWSEHAYRIESRLNELTCHDSFTQQD